MSASRPEVTDLDLHAYLDDELAPERAAAVAAFLDAHPEAVAKVDGFAELDDMIRRLYGPLTNRPVPVDLVRPLLDHRAGPGRSRRSLRYAAVAATLAGLLIGGGAGWWLRPQLEPVVEPGSALLAEARDAHEVFVVEARHPVEVPAAEAGHLETWLSNRLGLRLAAPSLEAAGFALVGGRLLPGGVGPAAQLMYEDAEGRRITLYLRARPDVEATGFRFARRGDLGAVHWREPGAEVAVLGRLDEDELRAAAEQVKAALMH